MNLSRPALTCRPAGALGYLRYPVCYKHAAPLGLNTSTLPCACVLNCLFIRVDSHGFADGFLCGSAMNLSRPALTCRPAGALGYLRYPVCYKHAAPLGLNTSTLPCACVLNCLFIRVDSHGFADGFLCGSAMNLSRPALTCRPAGALGYLRYPVCYKHAAPLGLNTSTLPCVCVLNCLFIRVDWHGFAEGFLSFSRFLVFPSSSVIGCCPTHRRRWGSSLPPERSE